MTEAISEDNFLRSTIELQMRRLSRRSNRYLQKYLETGEDRYAEAVYACEMSAYGFGQEVKDIRSE